MERSLTSPDFITKSFHQKIIDHAPVAMAVVYGPQFIIKMVNQLNLQLWQRKREEVIDKPLFEAFPETASQEFKSLLTQVYETGETFEAKQVPAQFFRNDVYETIWVNIKYEALRNEEGEIKAIIVTSAEVTNEVLLQKKVDDINARLQRDSFSREVLESSPDCVKILDSDGRLLFMNNNGLQLLGMENFETVKLKYWWQLWPLQEKKKIEDAIQQVKANGDAEFTAFGNSNAQGNIPRVWHVKLSLVSNSDDDPQIIVVSRDISLQHETKEVLRKTTQRLEGGLQLASIALAEIDYSNNTVQLTPEAALMYGFAEDTVSVSRDALHQTFHPDDRENMELLIAKVLDPAGDGVMAIEHPILVNDGEVKWLKVNKQVFFNRQVHPPVPSYSMLAAKDITAQKNVNRLLQESEAKYRALFEKVNQGFCIIEVIYDEAGKAADYRFLEYNNAFEQHSGLKNAVGKTMRQLVPGIERKWIERYGEVAQTGVPVHITEYSAAMLKWYDVYAYRHNTTSNTEVAILFTDITELKTYEQIILESEQRFRDIFTYSAVGIAVTRLDGSFVHVNQAYLDILGRTSPQVEQLGLYSFLHPGDMEFTAMNIQKLLLADQPGIVAETRFIHKSGRVVWTQLSMSVLEDKNGQPLHIISLVEDITEKKQVAEALLNSESRFRNIFENSGVSIWVEDFTAVKEMVDRLQLEGVTDFVSYSKKHPAITREFVEKIRVVDVNDYSLSMFEAAGKQELIEGLRHLFLEDKLTEFGSEMQAIADNSRYFEAERVTKTLKGKILHLLVTISFPVGTDYSTVLVSIVDITERKRAEAAVRESESRFRTLAETLPQLIWMADANGENSYRSAQWNYYTGISNFTNQQFWDDIVHPDDRKQLQQNWQQAVQEKRPFKELVRYKHYSGVFRWNEIAGYPLFSGSTYLDKWIGIVNDVHDLKLEEQKKDDFIGIASHEMRTPLTSAKGYLQVLIQDLQYADKSIRGFAEKALAAVNRLEALTTDLLDVTKVQHGQLNLELTTFDFNMLLDETIEHMQSITHKHAIVKNGHLTTMVHGDKYRLQQVLINLISNAVKYSPGADTVNVDLSTTGNELVVAVKDAGIGLDNTHLQKVFDRYYRVQEHANVFKGLGIGLYIAHNIILRHRGRMWAESELGAGSSFYFSIPVQE